MHSINCMILRYAYQLYNLYYVCYLRFYCCLLHKQFFMSNLDHMLLKRRQLEKNRLYNNIHVINFLQKYIFDAKNLNLILRFQPSDKSLNVNSSLTRNNNIYFIENTQFYISSTSDNLYFHNYLSYLNFRKFAYIINSNVNL